MANEQLRSMLNNLINEKSTEATLDFHQYITEQVKSIVGLSEGENKNRDLMDKEVKILSGRHKGKTGYVNKLIGKDEAEIQLDDDGDEFYVNVKLADIKQLDESAKALNEWYEGDSVFDFVRAVLSGDRDEMEEALRGSSLEKVLKKSGFSSVQEIKSAVKEVSAAVLQGWPTGGGPAGYEFSYQADIDGQAVTLISKKKISGINAKVVDIRKLN